MKKQTYSISLLNRWTVGNGVRERDTKFDDVCTSFLHGKHNRHSVLDFRIACSHKSDESRGTL